MVGGREAKNRCADGCAPFSLRWAGKRAGALAYPRGEAGAACGRFICAGRDGRLMVRRVLVAQPSPRRAAAMERSFFGEGKKVEKPCA